MQGMFDAQIERLCALLRLQRIWAINVGENFEVTQRGRRTRPTCRLLSRTAPPPPAIHR